MRGLRPERAYRLRSSAALMWIPALWEVDYQRSAFCSRARPSLSLAQEVFSISSAGWFPPAPRV